MLKLKLPEYNFKIKNIEGKLKIYDVLRKQYLVLTPEEWVRQHFVHYLINYKHVPASFIRLELGIEYNTLSKRPDIVCFSKDGTVWLIVECKASTIAVDDKVLMQLSTYYATLNSKYLAITNGLETKVLVKGERGFEYLPELPMYIPFNP